MAPKEEGKTMSIRQVRFPGMPAIAAERKQEPVDSAEAGRRMTWIEGATPDGEESRVAFEAITLRGLSTFEEVTEYLAKTSYWRDFLRGGWATDIGLLRPLYRREAREALERLNGRCLRIT
jgi:hypothetical protein